MDELGSILRVLRHDPRRHGSDAASVGRALEAERDHPFHERPALLLRGFPVTDEASFRDLAEALTGDVTPYRAGQTDRAEVADRVYEATKVPSVVPIPLHAEMSYSAVFPSRLLFWCKRRRCVGGASWLAHNRAIRASLSERLRKRLEEHGVRYRRLLPPRGATVLRVFRAFRTGAVKSWQESLGTEDRGAAEALLSTRGVPFSWTDDGWLDLSTVLPAFRADPITGESLWFNQIHTIHVTRAIYGRLVATLHAAALRGLPTNPLDAGPADGGGLSEADAADIARAHRTARVSLVLEPGDVLCFDNLRLSHGRAPYLGVREVRVVFCGLPSHEDPP